MKCAILENQTMMVRMTDFPATRGNPSTKSIVMSLHMWSGMGSGYRRPAGCKCSVLFRWQIEQLWMKLRTRWCA
jgi:hypothetical protein